MNCVILIYIYTLYNLLPCTAETAISGTVWYGKLL